MKRKSLRTIYSKLGRIDKVIQDLGQNIRVLDIGCGVGNTLIRLKELFPYNEYYGVAKNTPANLLEGFHYLKADVGKEIPFEEDFFDFAYTSSTYLFVKDKVRMIEEACRVLKPNASLRIYIPKSLKSVGQTINNPCIVRVNGNREISLNKYLTEIQDLITVEEIEITKDRMIYEISKRSQGKILLGLDLVEEKTMKYCDLGINGGAGEYYRSYYVM